MSHNKTGVLKAMQTISVLYFCLLPGAQIRYYATLFSSLEIYLLFRKRGAENLLKFRDKFVLQTPFYFF